MSQLSNLAGAFADVAAASRKAAPARAAPARAAPARTAASPATSSNLAGAFADVAAASRKAAPVRAAASPPVTSNNLAGAFADVAKASGTDDQPGLISGALQRGTRTFGADIQGITDVEGSKASRAKIAADLPRKYGGFTESLEAGKYKEAAGSATESILEAAPAVGLSLAATTATVLSGGGTVPAMLAGIAVSAPQVYGSTRTSQFEELGEVNNTRAAVTAAVSSTLDAVIPARFAGKVAGPLKKEITEGILKAVLNEGGKSVAIGSVTEGLQTVTEQIGTNPDNWRIIAAPKTPAEEAKRGALLRQISDSMAVGGILEGTVGGAGAAVQGVRQKRAAENAKKPNSTYQYAAGSDGLETYLKRLRMVESAGDDDADNKLSSATGRYQFVDGTWLSFMKRERPDLTKGRSDEQVLAMRSNPRLQEEMIRAFTSDNAKQLKAKGHIVSSATLGVMHRFGLGGGIEVLDAAAQDPNTPIASVVSAEVMAANPDLKRPSMDTAGEVVNFYEQRLGLGLGFDQNAPVSTRIGAADVRTRDDRSGAEFSTLGVGDAANAAADIFESRLERIFNKKRDDEFIDAQLRSDADSSIPRPSEEDTPRDAITKATRDKIANILESTPEVEGAQSGGQLVAAKIMAIADGVDTPAVPTILDSQLQEAAQQVLADLGYDSRNRVTGDFSPALKSASFRADPAQKVNTNVPRWKLANSLRAAFSMQNSTENLGRITPESGGQVIAQGLRALADKQGITAMAFNTLAKNKTGAARRKDTDKAVGHAKAKGMFTRAAAGIEYLSQTPAERMKNSSFTDATQARLAVLNALEKNSSVPAARELTKILSDFTPMMVKERSGGGAKGYFTFYKQLEGFATKAGATDAGTKEAVRNMYKVSERRAKTLKDNLRANEKERAAGRAEERNAVNEAIAKDVEAWHQSIANISASQELADAERLQQSVPMALDLLTGNFTRMGKYTPKQREPGLLFRAMKGSKALIPALDLLDINTMDREILRKIFPMVTLQGKRMWMGQHILRLGTAQQARTRSHVAETERVARILDAATEGTDSPREEQRRLTSVMQQATHLRLAAASMTKDGKYESLDRFFAAMRTGDYDETMQKADPNGRWASEGSDGQWAYADAVAGSISSLNESLKARPALQRDAYVTIREFFRTSQNAVLLHVVNNLRRSVGLKVVQSVKDFESIADEMEGLVAQDATLTDSTRKLLGRVLRNGIEGDYFPLQRGGKFSVFASQSFTITDARREGASAKANDAAKSNPFMQFAGRTAVAHPQFNPQTGLYEVKMEVAYYGQFHTELEAEKARAALLSGEGSLADLPDEIKTQRELEPRFRPDTVSAIMEVDSGIERQQLGGLSDEQAASLLGAAKSNVQLKNLLIELLPDRRMAASLRVRKDVLGAPPLISEIIRVREPAVAAALGALTVAQDTRELFAKFREHQERTVKLAADAPDKASRQRLQRRANAQNLMLDYLEKTTSSPAEVFPVLRNFNDFLSRAATVWFLAGSSHIAMNAVQVPTLGIPYIQNLYGPAAGARLMVTLGRTSITASLGFLRGRLRSGSTRGGIDYILDGQELDARRFYTTDEGATEPRINTLAEMKKLTWDEIAGKPVGESFKVGMHGEPQMFLLSQAEFEAFQKGRYSLPQVIALSNARKGGHLAGVFTEEARITKIRSMMGAEKLNEKVREYFNRMFDVATFAPAIVEYSNRLAVVLSTFEEETRKLKEQGIAEISEPLFGVIEANASQLNDRININYTTANRSEAQRSMGVLGQFTSYPLQMMTSLWHITTSIVSPTKDIGGYTRAEAAVLVATLFVTISAFAGGRGGMPWFLHKAAEGGLMFLTALFDDEDEDDNDILDKYRRLGASVAIEATIRETSKVMGDLWSEGPVSMATGASLQNRMGVHEFPLRIDPGLELDRNSLGSMILGLLGPAGSIAGAALDTYAGYKDSGEIEMRRLAQMLPKFVRDAGRTYDYVKGDGYKDASGKTIISHDTLEAAGAGKALFFGFTPEVIANTQRGRLIQSKRQLAAKGQRTSILRNFAEFDSDRAMGRLNGFNWNNLDSPITSEAILRSVKDRYADELLRQRVSNGLDPDAFMQSREISEAIGLGE